MKKNVYKAFASVLAFILAFCAVNAACFAAVVDSGECGEGVTWTLDDTDTLTISGKGKMDGYMTRSPAWRDPYRLRIKTVRIEPGVTSIGNFAFGFLPSITSVTIPDTVTIIGEYAFNECTALKSVVIPDSVTDLGIMHAFLGCTALESVILPAGITTTGFGTFMNCTALKSITVPSGVTKIEGYTFYGCTALTSVTIPASVTNIERDSFFNCTSLADVYFTGSEEQWNAIEIGIENDPLLNANLHFNQRFPGDVTGDERISAADARAALRMSVMLEPCVPGSPEFLAADVNMDNSITAADARMILRRSVKLLDAEWGVKQ